MRLLLYFLCLLLCISCQKKTVPLDPEKEDFATLSGKDLPVWRYIQTKEDQERLVFFSKIYEENRESLKLLQEEQKIPNIVHFIWIGPKTFPRESVENVRTWMAKHPGWTFKFWTDRERPTPCPGMERHLISELTLSLLECYRKTDNYGEKSDLLRYEILWQQGGIYADHDVKCMKSFEPMNKAYDFFCGIEMPNWSALPSCVSATNNLIGIVPHHPILKRCLEDLKNQWDTIGNAYPGETIDEQMNRIHHRTFWLFGEAVREKIGTEGRKDIVFPAYYFDAPSDELAIWARHLYSGAWSTKETAFENMVRKRLVAISKKNNRMFLYLGLGMVLNTLFLAGIALHLRKKPL